MTAKMTDNQREVVGYIAETTGENIATVNVDGSQVLASVAGDHEYYEPSPQRWIIQPNGDYVELDRDGCPMNDDEEY